MGGLPLYTPSVGEARRHHRLRLRLTPLGWILAAAALVLVILTIVAPSPGIVVGLIAVIVIWAVVLQSSFPFGAARGTYPADAGTTDHGREAAEDYERKHGHPF